MARFVSVLAREQSHTIDLSIDGETQKVLIEYYALRDEEGKYLGCLEASQNIQGLQTLEGEKRLLD